MSNRNIADLNPRFQQMVKDLLVQGQAATTGGWKLFITDGLRTMQEQTDLYAQGRTKPGKIVTNAKAGQSAHNYGMAVDLAFQKNGALSYDAALYRPVYDLARKLGFFLGADWTSFKDYPHFELPNWEKEKDMTASTTSPAKIYSEAELTEVRLARDENWNKYQQSLVENAKLSDENNIVKKQLSDEKDAHTKDLELIAIELNVPADMSKIVPEVKACIGFEDQAKELQRSLEEERVQYARDLKTANEKVTELGKQVDILKGQITALQENKPDSTTTSSFAVPSWLQSIIDIIKRI